MITSILGLIPIFFASIMHVCVLNPCMCELIYVWISMSKCMLVYMLIKYASIAILSELITCSMSKLWLDISIISLSATSHVYTRSESSEHHGCPSQMNENLMISNGKLTSDCGLNYDVNHQLCDHLLGTIMQGVNYIMRRIVVGELIDKFK